MTRKKAIEIAIGDMMAERSRLQSMIHLNEVDLGKILSSISSGNQNLEYDKKYTKERLKKLRKALQEHTDAIAFLKGEL